MLKNSLGTLTLTSILMLCGCSAQTPSHEKSETTRSSSDLWAVHAQVFEEAKYIDLTHAFEPVQSVWGGFGNAEFRPAKARSDMGDYAGVGDEFTYKDHGFIATEYLLPTDQYGTQLDPPAHWNPMGATISDIPASYAIHPLVVINVAAKNAIDPGYHLQVGDVIEWEAKYGKIPVGAVVMVRSDWHKKWGEHKRFNQKPFPGVGLEALKFLHNERGILFHGHEPLDTDTTANLEGEYWLMHNNFAQAEGVANLDQVPEKGALIMVGFAKPLGGSGGFARYIAIAPKDWKHGITLASVKGKPLPTQTSALKRDKNGVLRPRE